MEISKHQNRDRNHGIGGSDVAAILGLSPYKTPLELWAEKVGHPAHKQQDAVHLRFGQFVEPFVASEFERLTGLHTQEHTEALTHPEHDFMYGHIDRFVVKDVWDLAVLDGKVCTDSLLECKTAGLFSKDDWGPAGSDQVPSAYLLQCVWYMAITGCSTAHIAVLIGNADFRVYRIERDLELEALVIEKAKRYWFDHVLEGVPPTPQTVNDLRLLYPHEDPNKAVQADSEVMASLAQLRALQEESKSLDEKSEQLKLQIMQAMGEAQTLCLGSEVLATWKSPKPSQRIDTSLLKKDFPEIARQCTVSTAAARRFLIKE
jgi:putative phage-type endonuclease